MSSECGTYIVGSVYFTGDILAATDQPELFCAGSRRFGLVA